MPRAGINSVPDALGIEGRRLFLDAGLEPNVVARSHTHQLAGALVQRGIGYAFLDTLTIRALLRGGGGDQLRIRSVEGTSTLPVVAAYPSQRRLGNAASVFIDCFQAAFERLQARSIARIRDANEIIEI